MNESNFNPAPFTYHQDTGAITRDGEVLGSANGQGYLLIQHKGVRVLNHRLAWRLATGEWPQGEVDHINGDPSDNRMANLRVVTSSQNKMNRKVPRNNTSGEPGAYVDRTLGRWRVAVKACGKRIYFYASHSISAVLAARMIRREMHGEFASVRTGKGVGV